MLRVSSVAPGSPYTTVRELWHRGAAEMQVGLSILARLTAQAAATYHDTEPASPDGVRALRAVHRMAEFHQHAENVFNEIDSLATNLHTTWSGRGAAAHAEAHRHWARGAALMRESLARLRAAGSTAPA
jgi:uncharacterized protein YukE